MSGLLLLGRLRSKSLEIERETLAAALRLLAESLRQQEATAGAVREAVARLRCPGRGAG